MCKFNYICARQSAIHKTLCGHFHPLFRVSCDMKEVNLLVFSIGLSYSVVWYERGESFVSSIGLSFSVSIKSSKSCDYSIKIHIYILLVYKWSLNTSNYMYFIWCSFEETTINSMLIKTHYAYRYIIIHYTDTVPINIILTVRNFCFMHWCQNITPHKMWLHSMRISVINSY